MCMRARANTFITIYLSLYASMSTGPRIHVLYIYSFQCISILYCECNALGVLNVCLQGGALPESF